MNTDHPITLPIRLPEHIVLNQRQLQVLSLLLQGKIYKSIATDLHISLPAVRQNAHRLYKKLDVGSRIEVMIRYRISDNKSYQQ
jgi:DNA-binding NarL/FixJ family response regulator